MWTNERGCFRTDKRIHFVVRNPYPPFSLRRLPVVMQVVFKSGDLLIRSLIPKLKPNQPVFALVHNAGNVSGNGLNQITVRYNVSTDQFNKATAYYFAATLNNAHYEFRDMCEMDNIVPQHSDMKYLLQPTDASGSTVMLHKMGTSANLSQLWNVGLSAFIFANMPGFLPTLQYMAFCPPDLVIGTYKGDNAPAVVYQSDQIRLTMYHELGHAVHYRKAGIDFWQGLVGYEAQMSLQGGHNAPYGSINDPGYDKCALAEMWAEHIGYTYLHRRYGIAHSTSFGLNLEINSYFARLERIHVGDEYIPYGLLHDLMDNNTQNTNVNPDIKEDVPFLQTVDNISGFTNKMLFDQLWSGSENIWDYKDNLRSAELPSTVNTVAAYNALWAFYGY